MFALGRTVSFGLGVVVLDSKVKRKLGIFGVGWGSFWVAGLWGATQSFAAQVEYHPEIGKAWFRAFDVPVFSPFKIVDWSMKFGKILPNVVDEAMMWLWGIVGFGFFVLLMILKKKKVLDSHGSARWADMDDVKKMGLLDGKGLDGEGVILGRSPDGKHLLQHDGPEHISLLAPTRSGKGVCTIIPTLLTWKFSMIITDIKGENWAITSGYRKTKLGSKVLKFEPASQNQSSVKYNPLNEIRVRTKSEMQDTQMIADMLVDPDGKGQMDHWAKTGHALLVGTITHLNYVFRMEGRGIPSLADVASFLSRPDKTFEDSLTEMKTYAHIKPEEALSEDNIFNHIYSTDTTPYVKDFAVLKHRCNEKYEYGKKLPTKKIRKRSIGEDGNEIVEFEDTGEISPEEIDEEFRPMFTHPKVAETAAELQNKSENERSGVLSTAMSFLGLYRDPVVAYNTSGSDFVVSDLMRDDFPVTLYIVIEPPDLERLRPLIRIIINMTLKRLASNMEFADGKQVKKDQRCLILTDEFPAFGNLQSMETALAFVAGYGVKILLIAQDVNQINKHYTENNSVLSNCLISMFFTPSPSDKNTPKLISEALGKKTIEVKNISGKQGSISDKSESVSAMGRELMTPEEVRQLSMEESIIFFSGQRPIHGKKLRYYNEKFFMDRVMAAPEKSDRIR